MITKNVLQNMHQELIHPAYTYRRRPLRLVLVESYADVRCAKVVEKQIKRWGRKKKDALVHGDIALLATLSECRNDSHCKYFRK